jgi:hypothetical protein
MGATEDAVSRRSSAPPAAQSLFAKPSWVTRSSRRRDPRKPNDAVCDKFCDRHPLIGQVQFRRFPPGPSTGAGRTKPPRSTTRKRTVRREVNQRDPGLANPFGRAFVQPPRRASPARASTATRSLTLCEKKTSQFATSSLSGALTRSGDPPSVPSAPSTERPRLMVSPRGSRFGGGQSESRTKAPPARCISLWTDVPADPRDLRVRLEAPDTAHRLWKGLRRFDSAHVQHALSFVKLRKLREVRLAGA